MDEILWCYHSNETSPPVLTHGAICFSQNEISEFGRNLLLAKFDCEWFKSCFWIPSEMHLLGVFSFFEYQEEIIN